MSTASPRLTHSDLIRLVMEVFPGTLLWWQGAWWGRRNNQWVRG